MLQPEWSATLTIGRWTEDVDKELGNKEGFTEGFDFKTPARGVATHVYASFEPSLKVLSFPFTFNAFSCQVELISSRA